MLLALINFGLERMGWEKRSNLNRSLRPSAGRFLGFWVFGFLGFWVFGFLGFARVARPIKPCRRKPLGLFQPIRSSPQVKKTGSHARMIPGKDRGTGCTLRSVGVSGFFQQGLAGTRARGVRKGIPPLAIPAAVSRKSRHAVTAKPAQRAGVQRGQPGRQ